MTTALSDQALLEKFDEVINNVGCAESHSQLSLSVLVGQLNPLVKDFKGLDSVFYRDIKSYHDSAQTATNENRENSFDNQQGMLKRLNGIKEEYMLSLIETYST